MILCQFAQIYLLNDCLFGTPFIIRYLDSRPHPWVLASVLKCCRGFSLIKAFDSVWALLVNEISHVRVMVKLHISHIIPHNLKPKVN